MMARTGRNDVEISAFKEDDERCEEKEGVLGQYGGVLVAVACRIAAEGLFVMAAGQVSI